MGVLESPGFFSVKEWEPSIRIMLFKDRQQHIDDIEKKQSDPIWCVYCTCVLN